MEKGTQASQGKTISRAIDRVSSEALHEEQTTPYWTRSYGFL
jgi:hypothetical protein